MSQTRESVILQIEKKLNDAYKLALENKNLIGNTLFADSILSLKQRWCIRGAAARSVKKPGSRAITFTENDFKAKKKARDVKPVVDEWADKTLEHVKVMAKGMGLGIRGKDRDQLIKEIEWERQELRAQKNKIADKSEEE